MDDRLYLKNDSRFQGMPEPMRQWVLASPHAVTDFAGFFRRGGMIKEQENIRLPYSSLRQPPSIVVDASDWDGLNRPGMEYAQRRMFGALAHEIGHDRFNPGTVPFDGRSAEEYVEYRAGLEAQAIFNAFPIFRDLEQHPDFKQNFPFDSIGYLSGLELGQMYKQWRVGDLDDKAVVDRMTARVPDRPYTLGRPLQDQNADGRLTHRDLYLRDYAQYVAPKLEPQASDELPRSPDDPKHPDHAMLQKIREGVHGFKQHDNRIHGDAVERVSRSLLATSKQCGLDRVDHVVFGIGGRSAFTVKGGLHDLAHQRAHVAVEQAINTPVEKSDAQLEAANRQLVEQQALARQQELARGPNDPARDGPVMR